VTARAKLLARVLAGSSDQTIPFADLISLLEHLGFQLRTAGSHHILFREGIVEILNLQPRRDGTAKPYQVKQARMIITSYKLTGDES